MSFTRLVLEQHKLSTTSRIAGLAVDAGFRVVPEPSAAPRAEGDFRPPPGWNGKFKDVWTFEYRRCDFPELRRKDARPGSNAML